MKAYPLLFTVLALSLLSCGKVDSADQPIEVPATLKVDPVQRIKLGHLVATFEKTTLNEIRQALGVGSIEHKGDAGESVYWLCYSLPDQELQFKSHGEMGGPEHRLTGVSAKRTVASHPQKSCPMIPSSFQPVSFDFGWIETSQETLIKVLGNPSGKQGDTLIFHYHRSIYKEKTVIGDVTSRVDITLASDKIISLDAWHVVSY